MSPLVWSMPNRARLILHPFIYTPPLKDPLDFQKRKFCFMLVSAYFNNVRFTLGGVRVLAWYHIAPA